MAVVQRIILLLVLFQFAEKVKGRHNISYNLFQYNNKFQYSYVFIITISGNECLLKFYEEPPTQLNCDPYRNDDGEGDDDDDDDEEWTLRLACEVRIPVGFDHVQYEVRWFQRNNESKIIDHGRPEGSQKTDLVERITFGLDWYDHKFTTAMLGDYWCQAMLTDRQPLVNLSKSNILTVREPDYYDSSLPTCSGLKFIHSRRCITNITISTTSYDLTPSIVTNITTLSSSSSLYTSVALQSTPVMTSSVSMATSSQEIIIPSPTALTPSSRTLNQQDILLPIAVGIGFGLLILGIVIVIMLAAILYKCKERKGMYVF